MSHQYTLDDLLYLMARLRDPKTGCPWDITQDYASIAPSTLEEAYEVVDAIGALDFGMPLGRRVTRVPKAGFLKVAPKADNLP